MAARGLRKSFDDVIAVDGVDLDVPRGTCFGLLGPNGAGKTTTIRMIQCQATPSGGSLEVLGLNAARNGRSIKQRLGVVPQENNLDPDFTVLQNLTMYARYYRIPKAEAKRRAVELLGFLELSEKTDKHVNELSGGMKRRLIVARSLLNQPDLLVLDEPTTGLDPQSRHLLWDKIRDLRRRGTTILLTTHYMDEAERLCDRLVVMDHGKILESGTPRELIEKHTGGEAVEYVVGWDQDGAGPRAAAAALAGLAHQVLPDRVVAFGSGAAGAEEAVRRAVPVQEVVRRKAGLEDVFLRLTGRALRD